MLAVRVQLPDGRWLEAGGTGKADSLAAIVGADGKRVPLAAKLSVARQGHSLTLLADGRVLVLGGASADGAAVASAEVFDAATQTFKTLAPTGLSARVGAAVALLPDGRVLVSGGADSRGAVLGDAEVWDPKTNTVQRSALRNAAAGVAQTAALLPTGGVLLQGGQDAAGKALAAQVFDSREQRFMAVEAAQAGAWLQGLEGAQAPAVQGSSPAAEATGVDGEQPLSL
ncbi:kelch repeat-containing protein, partial [Ideonella sp. DXS29W]